MYTVHVNNKSAVHRHSRLSTMANPHRPTLPLLPHGSAHDQTKPARVKVVRYVSVARIARLIFVIAAPVQSEYTVIDQGHSRGYTIEIFYRVT